MTKQQFYYFCDEHSRVGRKLRSFWREAVHADEMADKYARKYGASSYVQPPQFFAGGVDFLEFDSQPDTEVWRKRVTTPEGIDEYEPNCMVRSELLMVSDRRFRPSDTWNTTFSREYLTWEQAKPQKTLQQWATLAGIKTTDDRDHDVAAVNQAFASMLFVPYLEFFGDQTGWRGKTIPQTLRRAIRAEKDRLALPVVHSEKLFALLEMEMPADKDAKKAFLQNAGTPIFFIQGETFFIRASQPCVAEGLHSTSMQNFNYRKNYALRTCEKD